MFDLYIKYLFNTQTSVPTSIGDNFFEHCFIESESMKAGMETFD